MIDAPIDNEEHECLLGELADTIGTYGLTHSTAMQLRAMLGFSDYTANSGRGVEGNDISGNGSQINFDMLLRVIRMAHVTQINNLKQMLSETHWSHDAPEFSYHHHRRGQAIEALSQEIKGISLMLWVLQGMNGNERRIKNFHWSFNKPVGDEE
tara:strand:- start:579 stop:1040 length:462 start_codon:yes stop_codon:yes gene_type:complete